MLNDTGLSTYPRLTKVFIGRGKQTTILILNCRRLVYKVLLATKGKPKRTSSTSLCRCLKRQYARKATQISSIAAILGPTTTHFHTISATYTGVLVRFMAQLWLQSRSLPLTLHMRMVLARSRYMKLSLPNILTRNTASESLYDTFRYIHSFCHHTSSSRRGGTSG